MNESRPHDDSATEDRDLIASARREADVLRDCLGSDSGTGSTSAAAGDARSREPGECTLLDDSRFWELLEEESAELLEHLERCPACRERAAAMRGARPAACGREAATGRILPAQIGPYEVVSYLGEGGMGVVYEAIQRSPRRRVALKVLRGTAALDERRVKLFRREIEALARLSHPGIAAIYEAGQTPDGSCFYFAMELVNGTPLGAYVRERGLGWHERLELFVRICEAVEYAHQQGVVHRDLKPSNILVDESGQPKVLDFGLARITDPEATCLSTIASGESVGGTLPYMSPEQAQGAGKAVDRRSDVYSLGVILYELLTGRQPLCLRGVGLAQAVRLICEVEPPRPGTIDESLRGDLDTIVVKALAKQPSERYASVAELCEDVRRFLAGEPIHARPRSSLYVARKVLARHRVAAFAGCAVLLTALVAWGASRWHRAVEVRRARWTLASLQDAMERGAGPLSDFEVTARYYQQRFPELPEAVLVWAAARYRRAQASGQLGLIDGSVSLLADQAEQGTAPWACQALLAEFYMAAGKDDKATELLRMADAQTPRTAEGCYVRSFATLDTHTAVKWTEAAVKYAPRYRPALWRALRLARLEGQNKRMTELLVTLAELGEPSEVLLLFKAETLMRQRQYMQAWLHYTMVIQMGAPAEVHRYRAVAALCAGRYEEAIEDYTVAADAVVSGVNWARYQRATPLWIVGRHAEAAADYRAVRKQRGCVSCAEVRLVLVLGDKARLLESTGDVRAARRMAAEAERELREAMAGVSATGWVGRYLHCIAGDLSPEKLVASAEAAHVARRCEACYYAGEACLRHGRPDEALRWFEQCLEVGGGLPLDPESRFVDPMNEYHLARWRARQLSSGGSTSQPAAVPASRPAGR